MINLFVLPDKSRCSTLRSATPALTSRDLGAAQHPALTRTSASQPGHLFSHIGFTGFVAAGAWLAGRCLLRRPPPVARFPTKTMYWLYTSGTVSASLMPLAAKFTYAKASFASSVVDYERIPNSTSFKLWARTSAFTVDDAMVLGGVDLTLLFNRSASSRALSFPNRQFARLGAMSLGTSVGTMIVAWKTDRQERCHHPHKHLVLILQKQEALLRLSSDSEFLRTLSRPALLSLHSSEK